MLPRCRAPRLLAAVLGRCARRRAPAANRDPWAVAGGADSANHGGRHTAGTTARRPRRDRSRLGRLGAGDRRAARRRRPRPGAGERGPARGRHSPAARERSGIALGTGERGAAPGPVGRPGPGPGAVAARKPGPAAGPGPGSTAMPRATSAPWTTPGRRAPVVPATAAAAVAGGVVPERRPRADGAGVEGTRTAVIPRPVGPARATAARAGRGRGRGPRRRTRRWRPGHPDGATDRSRCGEVPPAGGGGVVAWQPSTPGPSRPAPRPVAGGAGELRAAAPGRAHGPPRGGRCSSGSTAWPRWRISK